MYVGTMQGDDAVFLSNYFGHLLFNYRVVIIKYYFLCYFIISCRAVNLE